MKWTSIHGDGEIFEIVGMESGSIILQNINDDSYRVESKDSFYLEYEEA